jgi:hypothetical protein
MGNAPHVVYRWDRSSGRLEHTGESHRDAGYLTCRNYSLGGESSCFAYRKSPVISGPGLANLLGVQLPSSHQGAERVYVGYSMDEDHFLLHRFDIDPTNGYQRRRTRFVPIDSGGGGTNDLEMLQRDDWLFIIEGRTIHGIRVVWP